ncbi:MAG: Rieske 2Fe-2S domain-containing protein [Chloroflexi bacterium]|nr:Rieske 2Fe-2S domain-containing protein [Chloroflexota bacterium]
MLSREMNDRLTRVGPGTPLGELLRRYWQPIATTTELKAEPVLAVTLLGEHLALYRTDEGKLGLVSQRCPHRGASLAFGIPEEDGLRCPYHGWKFSSEGRCLEMPAEPPDTTFKERICIPAYPVQELGGLIWAYLGPAPAPLLPRHDLFVRDDLEREIGITRLPVNWLQIMENSFDPTHLEHLHTRYMNYVMKRKGQPPIAKEKRHVKIGFDLFEWGIIKRRLLEGQSEDADDWKIGHPVLFPNMLAVGASHEPQYQIRVPIDDRHTLHYWYFTKLRGAGKPPQTEIPVFDFPYAYEDGRLIVDTVFNQDMMVWVTQGTINDRTTERLGTSDRGIIRYRSLLDEQMEKVARGEDPMAVIRDPAKHTPMIEIPREHHAHFTGGGFIDGSFSGTGSFVTRTEPAATGR